MLKAKPKREDYPDTFDGDIPFILAECNYYRDALEYAVTAMARAYASSYQVDTMNILEQALSTIKGSQS